MSVTSLISAFLSFVIASPFIFLRRFPPLVGSTALLSVFLPIGAQAEIPLLCRCFGGYDYSGSDIPDTNIAILVSWWRFAQNRHNAGADKAG
jgi:hypothetical protein